MCTLDNTRFSKPLWILSTSFYWRHFAWMNLLMAKKKRGLKFLLDELRFLLFELDLSRLLRRTAMLCCNTMLHCFTFRRPHFLKCLVILSASLHDIARHTEYHWMQMKSCLLNLAGANGDGLQTDCWASLLERFWNRQASCEICIGSKSLEITTHPSVQF